MSGTGGAGARGTGPGAGTAPVGPDAAPVVPGYRIEHLLGTGGSAHVWRARAEADGAAVAVKVLSLHDGAAPGAARAEAALLAALDHPHLLALHALVGVEPSGVEPSGVEPSGVEPGGGQEVGGQGVGGQHAGAPRPAVALVLDLAEGGSLAALLRRRGRLAPGEVVTAVAPVAAALAYVHDEGLVHGDVTPANILFSAAGVPMLADLGVARVLGGYGEVRTTAAYADPAVAAGGRPTPASDVFMLAASAVHALTGLPPWPDPLPAAAFDRAAAGDLRPVLARLAELPVALADVLREALRIEPHLRPSAAAFALDLRAALTPVAVELAAGRGAGRPGFDRPAWTGSLVPTALRQTHVAGPAPSTAGPPRPRPGSVAARARRPWRPRRTATPGGRHASRHRRPRAGRALALLAVLATAGAAVSWSVGGRSDRGAAARSVIAASGGPDARATVPPGVVAPDTATAGPTSTGPTSTGPTSTAAAAQPGTWAAVLDALDADRARAYAEGDPDRLAEVYLPGALLTQDRAELAASVPSGCSLAGARTTYADVAGPPSAPGASPAQVTLTVRASLAPSRLQCPGAPAREVPGVAATSLRITLSAVDGGYRIAAQRPA